MAAEDSKAVPVVAPVVSPVVAPVVAPVEESDQQLIAADTVKEDN